MSELKNLTDEQREYIKKVYDISGAKLYALDKIYLSIITDLDERLTEKNKEIEELKEIKYIDVAILNRYIDRCNENKIKELEKLQIVCEQVDSLKKENEFLNLRMEKGDETAIVILSRLSDIFITCESFVKYFNEYTEDMKRDFPECIGDGETLMEYVTSTGKDITYGDLRKLVEIVGKNK